jgi:hypothetical protein
LQDVHRWIVLGVLVALALGVRRGEACVEAGAALGSGPPLEVRSEPVVQPVVAVASGVARGEGWIGGVSLGIGWGERELSGLFPGTMTRRVLLHVHRVLRVDPPEDVVIAGAPSPARPAPTRLALTYGWFQSVEALFDAGVDLGVSARSPSQLGPIAQLTLGMGGVNTRFTLGAELGASSRAIASAELVIDLATLARRIAG